MSDTSFLGFIEGTLLVVDQVFDGAILIGQVIYGDDVAPGTTVVAWGTGTGGAGSYTVDINQVAAGPEMFQTEVVWPNLPFPDSGPPGPSTSVPAAELLTGPDYPRVNVVSGENAIGSFKIGVSQVGDIPIFDLWSTVLSQYANSPTIMGLIEAWDGGLDQTRDFNSFYDNVWNVDSAWGYGLDIWGRIVGIARVLKLADLPTFGFAESFAAGTMNVVGFNQGMFFTGDDEQGNVRSEPRLIVDGHVGQEGGNSIISGDTNNC